MIMMIGQASGKQKALFIIKCKSYPFTYIGESKRSWNSRGSEHKPGTRRENFSAIKQHAETTTHDIHSDYVEVKEKGVNSLRQRQFLESWHSEADKNSVNEKKEFPRVQSFCKAKCLTVRLLELLCIFTLTKVAVSD